jgi:hypothetical protein
MFIAGVVRWTGTRPPTADQLKGLPIVDFAFAHLKAVSDSGGVVLGEAELQLAGIEATAESLSMKTWGFGVPKLLAERVAQNGS